MLTHCQTFNTGHHVLKLLVGGIKGAAGVRSRDERNNYPRRCVACGVDAVLWSWITPSAEQEGIAWCAACLGQHGALAVGWPFVLRRLDCEEDSRLGVALRQNLQREPACLADAAWHRSVSVCQWHSVRYPSVKHIATNGHLALSRFVLGRIISAARAEHVRGWASKYSTGFWMGRSIRIEGSSLRVG